MSATFTPWPWDFCGPAKPTADAPEGGDYAIQDGGTDIIAEVFYRTGPENTHNALANARLIAAAPDMLQALRRAVLALAFAAETSPAMRDDYEVVSEAIAKATGVTA